MSDTPLFVVAPPIRCFHRLELPELPVCARPARWIRPSANCQPDGYFCDEHRQRTDAPIAEPTLIRRVNVTLEVLFAATSWTAGCAHAEALSRLERAVESAGGVINLHAVGSVIGRCAAPGGRLWPAGARTHPQAP
ncbi:MAG: hypothetical protein HOQ29_12045 [Acidobacteria bacterium]|nr:hypothetical protein [Acidobacteriota bacterium]